jgi:dolichol-phosphate mannosyltransferase
LVSGRAGLDRVLVVCPTFDERETLPGAAARLRRAVPEADLLVVDDASPDGTGGVADGLAERDPQVHVLHRSGKAGLGRAYVAGFAWAAERGYDVVVEMDADGSHAPEELPRLLAALADADVVLGSRWVPGGSVLRWPARRRLLSRGGNAYVRLVMGLPFAAPPAGSGPTGPPRWRPCRWTLSRARATASRSTWSATPARGLEVVEVPITFTEREQGRSKMSRSIVVEALWRVTAWGLTDRTPGRLQRVVGVPAGSGTGPWGRS